MCVLLDQARHTMTCLHAYLDQSSSRPGLKMPQDGLEVYLPMAGLVDKDKERARLEKQAGKLTKDIEVLEKRLSGSNFVEKVHKYCCNETPRAAESVGETSV